MRLRRVLAATTVAVAAAGVAMAAPAQAQTAGKAASASADAYGLDVDVLLLQQNVPVDVGPISRASMEFPPGADTPVEEAVLNVVIPPGSGEVVKRANTVGALAGATSVAGSPTAVASAEVEGLELLPQAGVPLISATAVRAQSNSNCVDDPNAAGTEILGLKIGPQILSGPFEPNTVIQVLPDPLNILTVVINEQHPANEGRGLVVNGLHVYGTTTGDPLIRGDIIVSHAATTVNCPNGKGTTGADSAIAFGKNVSKPNAKAGETVTYTGTVTNRGAAPCIVNQFIDHLPQIVELVSTTGAFGEVAEIEARPGGGSDVVLKPEALTIAPGASATQTYVVKIKDDAAPGTYFNTFEVLCSNNGNFISGPLAPLTINPNGRKPQCSDGIDNDKDGKIDFPADPGCDSANDDDEKDKPRVLERTGTSGTLAALAAISILGAAVLRRRSRVVS